MCYTPSHHLLAVTLHVYLQNAVLNRERQMMKSCTPARSLAHKNKECVHVLTGYVCVFTSLPGDDETEYRITLVSCVRVLHPLRIPLPSALHSHLYEFSGNRTKPVLCYTLSHPENGCEVTERAQGYTLQDASFMRQSRCSFLNA